MVVRCTKKVLDLIGSGAGPLTTAPAEDADWYLNLVWIDRRKCLLLVHVRTLFSVFVADVRKADLRPFGRFVVTAVAAALEGEGLSTSTLGLLDPSDVQAGKTASRSVLGFMNEMAFHARYLVDAAGGLEHSQIGEINRQLRRTPYNRGEYVWPIELAGGTLDRHSRPSQHG
jgi:hypothetical protein